MSSGEFLSKHSSTPVIRTEIHETPATAARSARAVLVVLPLDLLLLAGSRCGSRV